MPRMFSQAASRATWSMSVLAIMATPFIPSWLAAQDTPPETHTVREGDTLWDLAKRYRGDPFLWPDIYRMNTAVVEDPHWIYPGEVLRLSGSDSVRSVPSTDTPVPSPDDRAVRDSTPAPVAVGGLPPITAEDSAFTPLFAAPVGTATRETLRAYTQQPYQPLRRTEFYSSGFLTEGDTLPFGTLLGPLVPSQIRSYSNRDVAMLYTTVGVEAPMGTTYRVGDSLLVVRVGVEIPGYGNVIIPTGLAKITEAVDGRYLASVVAVYGPIRKGQQLLPVTPFVPSDTLRARPVVDGVRGHLLGGKGPQEMKAPQMVVFFDKGRRDGVAAGDVFEARRRPRRLADGTLRDDDVMAVFQVVKVGERTSTARITNVLSPDVPPGTEVRQIAKLP